MFNDKRRKEGRSGRKEGREVSKVGRKEGGKKERKVGLRGERRKHCTSSSNSSISVSSLRQEIRLMQVDLITQPTTPS